ncbi:MAG: FAD-dependent monooxygenase, partial [Candidatus Eremiobacterota bacterium]
RHEISVYERNPRDNTFGWGVVFSAKTIGVLAEPDPALHRSILRHLRTWEDVDIVHRGETISVAGNRFSGIARLALLNVLRQRCEDVGVRLHFERSVEDPAELGQVDLVVGADGVGSALRKRFRNLFRPRLTLGGNRYIWYGTPQSFGGLTLIFRPHQGGMYMAHCYRYSPDMSTFIVEVDEETWASLRRRPESWARRHLREVFAADLGGHPLLSNRSRWIRFTEVCNRHWWARNMVLLGDSLHTAHFSIGSGTKLAMESSIALWRAFQEHSKVEDALPAFEAARRPAVEDYQAVAGRSQRWFESARSRMHLDPVSFAYEAMTRSSRLDAEVLERRDPAFVARYRALAGRV